MLQVLELTRHIEPEAAGRGTNLRHLRYPAHAALILRVVLGAGEGVRDAGRAAVNRGVGGGADVELGKGVEVNFDLVLRVALALSLDLSGLVSGVSMDYLMTEPNKSYLF
jgi:hypothetical protein